MRQAILYHRVSTREQDPELAREALYAAAKQRGYGISAYIREIGSGARNDRPGLQRVMEHAHRGEIAAVLVWKLDRFGRSVIDVLNNIQQLRSAGVRFIATTQGLDIGPEGDSVANLMLNMLAAVAEFERDIIRERTQAGLDNARRKGRILGRPRDLSAPQPHLVKQLREQGNSWSQISKGMGCTVSAARRAFERAEEPERRVAPFGRQQLLPGTEHR